MNNRNSGIWWVIGVIVALLIIVWGIWVFVAPTAPVSGTATATTSTPVDTTAVDSGVVSELIVSFGGHLQNVSLLAPNASSTIASEYALYVDPTLLKQWESNPRSAPGRITSSPSPSRIQVASVTPNGGGYTVTGNIVLTTSTGDAGTQAFVATVVPEQGNWYITNFTVASSTTS